MSATKKQAILDTALDMFVEHGIDATSIRSIAEGAGTAEENIYRHFKSKDELARVIFLDCASTFRQTLNEAIKDTGGEPEKQLKLLVRAIFEFSINNKHEFAYILVVHHREEIFTREILSKPLPKDIFIQIISNGIEKGVFQPVDPTIAVTWIVGMVQRCFTFTQHGITDLPQDDVVEQTVRAALRVLRK